MPPQLQIQGTSIVLRGSFNPAIFHPSWFASNGLIRRQEAEAAKVEIVHPKVAVFSAEWLQVNIAEDRFQVATTQEPFYEALRDLVSGVLDLLSHTPLSAMGLNRDFHYGLQSEAAWHGVGHRLAAKQDWEDVLEEPGMPSLTMQGKRPDHLEGCIRVKVEPSAQVKYGVYVNVNDHYQLKSGDETSAGTREAMGILTNSTMSH